MKVIDLLNKIANGEEVPKIIIYKNIKYELHKERGTRSYYSNDNGDFLMENIKLMGELSSELEVMEKDEEIDIDSIEELNIESITTDDRLKINELIKAVKQLNKKIKEKE